MSKRPIYEVDEDQLRDAMLEVPAMRGGQSVESVRKEPVKHDHRPYREQFLVNDGVCLRVSTYVNRDIHEKIKRLLSNAAPEVSIASYINNILAHHLEQYEQQIEELYRAGVNKPLMK